MIIGYNSMMNECINILKAGNEIKKKAKFVLNYYAKATRKTKEKIIDPLSGIKTKPKRSKCKIDFLSKYNIIGSK